MWPFKKNTNAVPESLPPQQISVSQVDITERFGDHLSLGADDWIETTPLNASIPNPQAQGLPPLGASEDEVHRVAARLSEIRESIGIPNDGVYCPVCHIANVTLSGLRTPCPRCGRPLLRFGWD
jgi:hypothetical protein